MNNNHIPLKLLLLLSLLLLQACAGPTFYEPVTSVDRQGNQVTRMQAVFRLDADVEGDMEYQSASGTRFSVKTPRDSKGNVLIARTAILNKAKTAVIGYSESPMTAKVLTSPVVAAKWKGANDFFRTGTQGASTIAGTLAAPVVASALIGPLTP
jgi:hypothetical protein